MPTSPPDEGGDTDGVVTVGCNGGQCWAQTTWMTGGGQEEVVGAGAVGCSGGVVSPGVGGGPVSAGTDGVVSAVG